MEFRDAPGLPLSVKIHLSISEGSGTVDMLFLWGRIGSMHILGISTFYHDSAACLLRDGQIVAAAQEERFSRRKHDFAFPAMSSPR